MTVPIPVADPATEYREQKAEIDEAVASVLASGRYVLGPEVRAFESEFGAWLGVPHAVGVASGTDAVRLALSALRVGEGDEVVTTSHTAVATVAAIEECGATPRFADISPATFTLDPASARKAVSRRTKALLPVHLYGHPADMAEICDLSARFGIPIVEDAAQAHGAEFDGRKVGSFGTIAAFSFYPTKNLGALGDGGAVVTADATLAERVRELREYGWRERYVSAVPGINSRLDELQAAILRVKLRHLDEGLRRRRALASLYDRLLAGAVGTPPVSLRALHAYHLYVVRTPDRDALRAFLSQRGIGSHVHYPVPVHLQPAYAGRIPLTSSLAQTEKACREVLSLPLFPQLSPESVERVCAAVQGFVSRTPSR